MTVRTTVPLLLRLHFYAGLLVGPFVLVAALSGGLYALAAPVERVVHADLLEVRPVGVPQPLAQQVAAAVPATRVPGLVAVRPAEAPDVSTRVLFDDGSLGESELHAVFVHPGTAQVLGQERVYGTSGSLPQRAWVAQLHRSLHLGEPGRLYSELAASWLWVVALGGFVLWLRRGTTTTRSARNSVRRRHGVVGAALLLGLLALSATGLTWSRWAGGGVTELRAALGWQAPTVSTAPAGRSAAAPDEHAEHGGGSSTAGPGNAGDVDAVLAAARANGLRSTQVEVRPPATTGHAWTVREVHRAFPTQVDEVAVDATRLQVVDEVRFADHPLMAKLARWGVDLHTGALFGLPNQLALAALAAGICVQVVLGYRMWWQRRPSRAVAAPRRGAWRSAPRPALAALVLATVAVGWALPLLGAGLLTFLLLDVLLGRRAVSRPR